MATVQEENEDEDDVNVREEDNDGINEGDDQNNQRLLIASPPSLSEEEEDEKKEEFLESHVSFSDDVSFTGSPSRNKKNKIPISLSSQNSICSEVEQLNHQRVKQALETAGQYSSGIVIIEAWAMNERRTFLLRADGGFWRDPSYEPPSNMEEEKCLESLKKLEDPTANGYMSPCPAQPGLGIVGKLWAERTVRGAGMRASGMSKNTYIHQSSRNLFQDILDSSNSENDFPNSSRQNNKSFHRGKNPDVASTRNRFSISASLRNSISFQSTQLSLGNKPAFIWRDLQFMNDDPDNIPDPRINVFLEAGIGQVVGIPFNLPDSPGILLLYAKSETNSYILNDLKNVEFLRKSATFIGSAIALSEPMVGSLEAIEEREDAMKALSHGDDIEGGIRRSFNESEALKASLRQEPEKKVCCLIDIFIAKLLMVKDKLFLSNTAAKPPPGMSNSESLWSFFGAFVSMLAVCYSSRIINFWSEDKKYVVPLGPFGAFATLLYGLTAAPPSQPRNAIYGSAIAGCTGLTLSYMPNEFSDLRASLAAGIAISLQARTGYIHPPGGALAIILSGGKFHWGTILLYLISSSVMILCSMLINNMNEKRKYPQYWEMVPKL